ncbi:hypothetical protein M9Y10_024013 [Tritrichomonas musculus]|uniref:Uncharacterized protein n=1 Tax=Tritrichomonas musculus TaxID=1915356 RepID=A0ABR2KWS5_9EUKA
MNIQQYQDNNNEIRDKLLEYIDEGHGGEDDLSIFLQFLDSKNIQENQHDLKMFLNLISKLTKNYKRSADFFTKIFRILKYYENHIKKYFTNFEIFNIFKSSKRVLLFLFQEGMVKIDKNIFECMSNYNFKSFGYLHYFFPEIKCFLDTETINSIQEEIPDNFEDLRLIGENDHFHLKLIQKDLINDFVRYVNQANLHPNSKIPESIFETNSFLLKNRPNLIEYSVFYGSIQIFNYLRLSKAKMSPTLWLYAIHSRNHDIIHILEDLHIAKPQNSIEKVLCESIKCHHNEIANYIINNEYEKESNSKQQFINSIPSFSIQFYNLNFFILNDLKVDNVVFNFLCKFGYFNLVEHFMKKEFINSDSLHKSAEKNNIHIVHLLLSNTDVIYENSFKKCIYLNAIQIPSTIKVIRKSAFEGCLVLSDVKIPSSVTEIGENAFSGCSSITSIEIPSSVVSIGIGAFRGCILLEKVEFSSPSSINIIRHNCFSGCSSLKHCPIPNSVKKIENDAFSRCSSLTEVTFPSSILSISKGAFCGCSQIKQIDIPSSLTYLGESVFSKCTSLLTCEIHANVDEINSGLFEQCSSLTKVLIPASVTKIGSNAFDGCVSLSEVNLPSILNEIGSSAFRQCSLLSKIDLPSSLYIIGSYAFSECLRLEEIEIPSSVDSLRENTFENCLLLKKIKLPSNMISIGEYSFQNCSKLEEVTIPSSVKIIERGLFSNCVSLKTVDIPLHIEQIKPKAFYNCKSIEQIVVPPSITVIEDEVFYNCCSLKNI